MSKKVLILTAIVLVFSACQAQAAVIDSNWDGGGDGYSWGDANNWDPNIVPDNNATNTFVVTIDSSTFGVHGVDVGLIQSITIDQLDCNGIDLEKWTSDWVQLTLVDQNGLTNYGEFWSTDDIEIVGNVRNKAGAHMFLANLEIDDSNFFNEANAQLEIEEMVSLDPGSFTNNGWLFVIPAGDFWVDGGSFTNNGKIQIKNGLVGNGEDNDIVYDFVNASSGKIWGSGDILTEANIINEGSIVASSGVLVLYADGEITNTGILGNEVGSALHLEAGVGDVNNLGQINVNADGSVTVILGKLFTEPNACTLNNEPNGVINLFGGVLSAGTIVQKADANFAGFGGISVADEILIESGAKIELTGPTNIVGDVNIPAGATLEISDGQTLITGHTTCDGTIHLIGGTVVFQGGCDCEDCNIINEAGIDRNHFDLNADGIEDFKDFAYFAETWLWQADWYVP